jgi:hypothetical protein
MEVCGMSTILVEARRDPQPGVALDAIAATCRGLGHDVFRWRGPQSGRVPHWRWLFPCDLAVVWNGLNPKYDRAMARLKSRGTPVIYTELGWHPQRGHIQIDPTGINANASWAAEPLTRPGVTPLRVRESGDLLLVLQLDHDTQITRLSPWFADMRAFVEFMCRHSALRVRVRHHPRRRPTEEFIAGVGQLGGTWDESPSLAAAMAGARALACVNSSCGVEALAAGLPVLCYGKANYRHPGAVYCLDDDPQLTRSTTELLGAGRCALFQEPVAEIVARVLSRQWPVAEIPQRLPPLIETMLAGAEARSAAARASGLVSRVCTSVIDGVVRWTRDLPPKVLPARPAF